MDEKKNAPQSSLKMLADIVNDLWGAPQSAAAVRPAQSVATPNAPTARADAGKPYQATFPPFEQLWKVADETVDWTDALVKPHPTDSLTSEHLWSFFHSHADAVLKGRTDAYLEVLEAANPLSDLSSYGHFEVGVEDADTLCVSFEAEPAYMHGSTAELHRYLAGVSLRAARDLMALLPVCRVTAYAQSQGKNLLIVTFTRASLQKVRFGFTDPVELAVECGGQFDPSDAAEGQGAALDER